MRVFVKYNGKGEVLSVSRVQVMPQGLEHPQGELDQDEFIVELAEGSAQAKLDPLELHNGYKVDVKNKKLVKKPKS